MSRIPGGTLKWAKPGTTLRHHLLPSLVSVVKCYCHVSHMNVMRTTQARQTLPSFSFVITEPWSKSTVILSHMNVIHAITPPDMAKLQFCPHRTTFKEYRYISHMNVMRTGISPDIAKFQFCHYRTMVKEQCHHLSHMNVMRTITPVRYQHCQVSLLSSTISILCSVRFAATELQSNLLVEVADCRFHLHKVFINFPSSCSITFRCCQVVFWFGIQICTQNLVTWILLIF